MLTFTHTIIGGAIGAEVDNPGLSFSLGAVAHFIMDKVPHFWPETKKGKTIVMVTDGILTTAALAAFYLLFQDRPSIFWGAAGGAIVDVLLVLTPLYKTKVGRWHTNRQLHQVKMGYLATDLIILATGVAILYFLLRK